MNISASYICRRREEKITRSKRVLANLKLFEDLKLCDAECNIIGDIYKCNECGGQYHNRYECQLFVITNRGHFLCQDCWNLNFKVAN